MSVAAPPCAGGAVSVGDLLDGETLECQLDTSLITSLWTANIAVAAVLLTFSLFKLRQFAASMSNKRDVWVGLAKNSNARTIALCVGEAAFFTGLAAMKLSGSDVGVGVGATLLYGLAILSEMLIVVNFCWGWIELVRKTPGVRGAMVAIIGTLRKLFIAACIMAAAVGAAPLGFLVPAAAYEAHFGIFLFHNLGLAAFVLFMGLFIISYYGRTILGLLREAVAGEAARRGAMTTRGVPQPSPAAAPSKAQPTTPPVHAALGAGGAKTPISPAAAGTISTIASAFSTPARVAPVSAGDETALLMEPPHPRSGARNAAIAAAGSAALCGTPATARGPYASVPLGSAVITIAGADKSPPATPSRVLVAEPAPTPTREVVATPKRALLGAVPEKSSAAAAVAPPQPPQTKLQKTYTRFRIFRRLTIASAAAQSLFYITVSVWLPVRERFSYVMPLVALLSLSLSNVALGLLSFKAIEKHPGARGLVRPAAAPESESSDPGNSHVTATEPRRRSAARDSHASSATGRTRSTRGSSGAGGSRATTSHSPARSPGGGEAVPPIDGSGAAPPGAAAAAALAATALPPSPVPEEDAVRPASAQSSTNVGEAAVPIALRAPVGLACA